MGIIYMYTSPTQGRYVGQTCTTLEIRWKQHVRDSYRINSTSFNTLLCRAIRKYGAENFKLEILEDNIDQQNLDDRECYWIDFYKTFFYDNQHGYNLTRGGKGTRIHDPNIFYSYWLEGFTLREIKQLTQTDINTISRHLKGCKITHEEINQRSHEEEARQKIKCDLNVLQNLWHQGLLVKEIAEKLNYANNNDISNLLIKYLNISPAEIINRGNHSAANKAKQAIIQYDLAGNKIKRWDSAAEVQRELNYDASSIRKVCNHKNRTAYGFIWRNENDSFDDSLIHPPAQINRQANNIRIKVKCIETNHTYDSLSQASLALGFSKTRLSALFKNTSVIEHNNLHYVKLTNELDNLK